MGRALLLHCSPQEAAGLWGDLLDIREPQKRLAKWDSPCALGPLEESRPQSQPARGIHSIFWTPVTWPQPTWQYQGPMLQASSGLGTQGGHRPGSLGPGSQLAQVLSRLG